MLDKTIRKVILLFDIKPLKVIIKFAANLSIDIKQGS